MKNESNKRKIDKIDRRAKKKVKIRVRNLQAKEAQDEIRSFIR